jgi:hypothetical protein
MFSGRAGLRDRPPPLNLDGLGHNDVSTSEAPGMTDLSKRRRRLIREYSAHAHEAELRLALLSLAEDLDRWRSGEISSFELSDAIHEFHDGAARELWKCYNMGVPEWALARAIHSGTLDRTRVPDELLQYLHHHLEHLDAEENHNPDADVEDAD